MLQAFDPHYCFHGRSHLMSLINDSIALIKLGIQQDMASAQKINFCAQYYCQRRAFPLHIWS